MYNLKNKNNTSMPLTQGGGGRGGGHKLKLSSKNR